MFETTNPDRLRTALNQYPVPMFAAQREAKDQPFRLICLNDAHTRSTGLHSGQVAGLRPTEILPASEGRAVEERYASCVEAEDVVNYREQLHLGGRMTRWETTLLPITLKSGAQRVIGTALTLGLPAQREGLSDAEFFVARAQMQLGQIGSFIELIKDHADSPQDLRTGAMMMTGLNRSLEHLLQDVRLTMQHKPVARVDTRDHAKVLRIAS